ncbi:MAG: ATP-binding cassette domain-containing protein [Thermodesulfovibrionales bacterium]|nr:ATP-binding cassette domain-containing protein [Thermodesulfovibrionales bacterium]
MIKIEALTKTYPTPKGQITAVDNVSFTIERGSVFGLLGPNGAGKTTIIKILTTLSKPDSGRCIIEGFDINRHPIEIKKRIGVVPQENNLDRELTARENLLIYGMLHQVKNLDNKIENLLKMVGLWDRKDSIVNHFSGGMQRRLLLARALLPQPSILFLDEPTIGLDPQIRRQMWDIIRKTKIEGRTVIITTHYIEEAEALCDTIGILSRGKLIAVDTPDNLKTIVGRYVVDIIDDEGHLSQHIFKSRDEAHEFASKLSNCSITIRKSNLEDVFIKITGERI